MDITTRTRTILGLYWSYIGVILGLYWGYTRVILGYIRVILGLYWALKYIQKIPIYIRRTPHPVMNSDYTG